MLGRVSGIARQIFAKSLTLYLILAAVLFFIISYHISSSPAGLGPTEISAKNASLSLSNILNNPINAPHHLLSFVFLKAGLHTNLALRLSSVLFAELFIISFYSLTRVWFGKSIGLFGAVILATLPLFLIAARQGSSEIMLFSIITIMAVYVRLCRLDERKELAIVLLAIFGALFIYTPGIIWWVMGAAIFSRKKLLEAASSMSKSTIILSGILLFLLLAPLALAIAKDWTIIKTLALVPTHFGSIETTLKHLGWMVAALFVKTPFSQNLILGRLPVLNVIQITFLVFGGYAMYSMAKAKALVLAAGVLFGIIAAGFNNNLSLLALSLTPLVIFITAGLRFLYIEWRGIFPRNPLAKNLALLLMGAVVIVNLFYGLRYSLIAWPAAMSTKSAYVLK
jgi:hypothetical protein